MDDCYQTEFLTATIVKWQHLLQYDECKAIIVDSLEWLTNANRCCIYAFVIMPNHIHLLWRITTGCNREAAQGAFTKYTSHAFKKYLQHHNFHLLEKYLSESVDRTYQFWKRDPMIKQCWSKDFFNQKLDYIHNNPCQPHWNLVTSPEEYKWSSSLFYQAGNDQRYSWLTHYSE